MREKNVLEDISNNIDGLFKRRLEPGYMELITPGSYIIDTGSYNFITVKEANLLCNPNGFIYRSTPLQKFKIHTFSRVFP